MPKLADKALITKRESKFIEFKQGFDCDSKGEWCEVIKDFVAIANSGGGIVVFGLGDTGEPVDTDLTKIAALDSADVSNKIGAYIGTNDFDFAIIDLEKDGNKLVAFLIKPAATPYIFEKPGAYTDPLGKQKSAFAIGTCYFRHGAKSEPGTNDDLRKSIARQIESFRKEWINGVRKVVEAPIGSQIIVESQESKSSEIANVKLSSELDAMPIRLTRDIEGVAGTLLHEEISGAIFQEINNVIDTNRFLFPDQGRFSLGLQAYYRIYAERHHVRQPAEEIVQLLHLGITEYCPFLHWCGKLPDVTIAEHLVGLVLWPKGNEAHTLLRIVSLFGERCFEWLESKFIKKWGTYSQPPAVYWRLIGLRSKIGKGDARLEASHLSLQSQFSFESTSTKSVRELLADQATCNAFLSKACLEVFQGDKAYKGIARDLDYLANGELIISRGIEISGLLEELVGDQLPGDASESSESE